MRFNGPDPDRIVAVVCGALPVRGTVAAASYIRGGVALRVTGATNRARAAVALSAAGYRLVTLDDRTGILHIPPTRKFRL